jgi:tetratricopeptide (TPR) repeat protein
MRIAHAHLYYSKANPFARLCLCIFLSFSILPLSSSQTASTDTNKIVRAREVAKTWLRLNSDSSIQAYNIALLHAQALIEKNNGRSDVNPELDKRIKELLVRTHIDLGNELFWNGDYEEALKNYSLGLELAINIDDIALVGECYGEMATIYRNLGQHEVALEYNKKALSTAEILKDEYWTGILYNNRGVIYQAIGDYPRALRSFFSALNIYKDMPDVHPNIELLNIGRIYEVQGDLDRAMDFYKRSLKICVEYKLDYRIPECYIVIGGLHLKNGEFIIAREYFQKALTSLLDKGHHYRTDVCYTQIGETYMYEQNYAKAIEYYNRSISISQDKKEINTEGDTYLKLAHLYFLQNRYQESKRFALKALSISDSTGYPELRSGSYQRLSRIFEKLGDYKKAFNYQQKYNAVQDSLLTTEKLRALADMETKYAMDRKDIELSLLQEQKNISEEKLQRNRILFLSITGLLTLSFLLLLVLYFYFRQRSHLRAQALERQQLQLKHEFDHKIRELQILSLKNQLNPHFIFNALNSIGSTIIKDNSDKAYDLLTHFSELIRSSLVNSDKISISLKEELEFVNNYLVLEKNRFKEIFNYKISIQGNVDDNISLPRMAIQVFAENAVKHGLRHKKEGGLLQIDINQLNGNVEITIKDNGIGREKAMSLPATSTGKGLNIIREMFSIYEQLNDIKIRYEIHDLKDSEKAAIGTEVVINIPNNKNDKRE